MRYFKCELSEFEKEMEKVKEILLSQGYVLESDHPYAYSMQDDDAFYDVKAWLLDNGYDGDLESMGRYEKDLEDMGIRQAGAVYGLYDSNIISYEEMQEKLLEEIKRQSNEK